MDAVWPGETPHGPASALVEGQRGQEVAGEGPLSPAWGLPGGKAGPRAVACSSHSCSLGEGGKGV